MKKSLLAIVFAFIIFSCDNYVDSSAKIDNYIPESSSVVIKINNISKFKNSIINNEYLNKNEDSPILGFIFFFLFSNSKTIIVSFSLSLRRDL